jgi:hypothetical protein
LFGESHCACVGTVPPSIINIFERHRARQIDAERAQEAEIIINPYDVFPSEVGA